MLGTVLGVGKLGGRIQRWVKGQLCSIPHPVPRPATSSMRPYSWVCKRLVWVPQSPGGECHWLGVPPRPSSSPLSPLLELQLNVSARPQAEQGMYFQMYMRQGLGCQCCVILTGTLFSFPSSASQPLAIFHHYLPFLGKWLALLIRDFLSSPCPLLFCHLLTPWFYNLQLLVSVTTSLSGQWIPHVNGEAHWMSYRLTEHNLPIVGYCWEEERGERE